jgi:hypothetical protein
LSPRFLAAVAAVVFAGAGVTVLSTYGPTGALAPSDVAAGPDGPVLTAGRITHEWLQGLPPTTHLRLAGAADLDVVVQGNQLDSFALGDFVEVTAEKAGTTLAAQSIRPARDPLALAVPYFAVAAAVAAALLTLEAVRVPPGGRSRLTRIAAAIAKGMGRNSETEE